jgi:hypothetical protein
MKSVFPQIAAASVAASAADIDFKRMTGEITDELVELDKKLTLQSYAYVEAEAKAHDVEKMTALEKIAEMHTLVVAAHKGFIDKISNFASIRQPAKPPVKPDDDGHTRG